MPYTNGFNKRSITRIQIHLNQHLVIVHMCIGVCVCVRMCLRLGSGGRNMPPDCLNNAAQAVRNRDLSLSAFVNSTGKTAVRSRSAVSAERLYARLTEGSRPRAKISTA